MPLYVYECEKCKKLKEVITSFSDNEDKVCDECGSVAKKIPIVKTSDPVFKGSGFYKTDYKK